MSRKHFAVVRHFLKNDEWDYFQFVEIGLDRIQHGFWKYHDPRARPARARQPRIKRGRSATTTATSTRRSAGSSSCSTDDTVVLVVSDHGARRLDGGFCVNEWLVREGLLVLNQLPREGHAVRQARRELGARRAVWSEGGYYARVFFNVKGREPRGRRSSRPITSGSATRSRRGSRRPPTPTAGRSGRSSSSPRRSTATVRNVAPDLIVHFGGLAWRSIGGVGYPTLHVRENDTGPDDCNHAQHGAFILASSNNPLQGEVDGAHLLDIAPTLLELGGYDVPAVDAGPVARRRPRRRAAVGGGLLRRRRGDRPRPAQRAGLHLLSRMLPRRPLRSRSRDEDGIDVMADRDGETPTRRGRSDDGPGSSTRARAACS